MSVAKSSTSLNNNQSRNEFLFNIENIQKNFFNNENELAMHNELLIIFCDIVNKTFVFIYKNVL